MSFSNVGKVWSLSTLKEYLEGIKKPEWCKAVCLHHTAEPSLSQRPTGFTVQHIKNIEDFYKQKEWHAGPHFFTDEDQIFGMTHPGEKGIHAASFNSYALGIEVLGDYDFEFCDKGRGLECWKTATAATKIILDWLELPVNYRTVLFHRDDPKTRKTCPGTWVLKSWVIDLINKADVSVVTIPKQYKHDAPAQFVGVSEYLQTIKGYNLKDITEKLHKGADNLFYFGDEWLEGAFYDKIKQATVAPIKELCTIPNKK